MYFRDQENQNDALDYACEVLESDSAELEEVTEGSTNYLFRIKSGMNRGDFVKVYDEGLLDSTARRIGLSRWPDPEDRAEAEVIASEYMSQTDFETPETEKLEDDVVLLENKSGIPLPLSVLGSSNSEAEKIGRELGNCLAGMRENRWVDYDTNPGNFLVKRTTEGYQVASIDNEMFREDVPKQVIDSKAADVQENVRDSITGGAETPSSFYHFVDGFSEGYGEDLELKSGKERVLRDVLDLIRY